MDANNQRNHINIQQAIARVKLNDIGLDVMRVPVVGSSMNPVLRDRDILLISLVLPDTLKFGDIIVRGKNELITHRVLIVRGNRVYTKGDARYWIDSMISRDDIWGMVTQIERNGLIANMESKRWKIINRMIGICGRIQVYFAWHEQITGINRDKPIWWHRFSYWFSKKANWVILFLFAGRWLFQKPLRMDEKC